MNKLLCLKMSKQKSIKSPRKHFVLQEENGEIYAKLDVFKDHGIEMNVTSVPNVRVRAPRSTKAHLKEMAEMWANCDPNYSTSSEWLEKYNEGMNSQIISQIQEIRKSLKRIQSLSYAIKTAEQLIEENGKI